MSINMNKEKTLRDIIESDMDLFDMIRPPYQFNRIFSVGLIGDSHMELIDLPEGIKRTNIEYWEIREQGKRGCLKSKSFMEYEGLLVPLGTHTSERKSDFKVYRLDKLGNEVNKQNLYDFVLNGLNNKVTLTRVLSEREAHSWLNHVELGSTHEYFWKQPTIHTALHSVTSEFKGSENYSRAIMMHLVKEELRKIIGDGDADISTYSFLFTNRKEDSHFPFEIEITFRKGGFEVLRGGYERWKKESGVDSIENPFYAQPSSKV